VPTYLVERYWPGVTSELLLQALTRGRQVMEVMSSEGMGLRHVTSILIPSEEVVFSVYDGPSAAAVRQLNQRARIPASRIVDAIEVTGGQAGLVRRSCATSQGLRLSTGRIAQRHADSGAAYDCNEEAIFETACRKSVRRGRQVRGESSYGRR
jgi:Nickel responsive protein SCO4226-like